VRCHPPFIGGIPSAPRFWTRNSGCIRAAVSCWRRASISGYCFSHPWTQGGAPALDTFLGRLPDQPTTYYVHDLTLDEALRGQGLGRAIVPLLFECARSLAVPHLSLVAVNRRGPFWQAAGFVRSADETLQAAAREKYGENAVHMEKLL